MHILVLLFLSLSQLIFTPDTIDASTEQQDQDSIIIEVEGDPSEHEEYLELHHPFVKVVAVYDTLFTGIALQGKPEKLVRAGRQDFVKAVHPVHTYKTMQNPINMPNEYELFGKSNVVLPSAINDTNYTGKGVKVGVVDTGIDYNHPDLNANYKGGYDVVDLDDDPMETQPSEGMPTAHGTHVSGIIASNGSLKGVAPDADIYAYRALGPGGAGSSIQVIAAMEQAVKDGMDIINLSLGNTVNGPDYPTSKAVNKAVELGTAVVIANGNDGPDNWTVGSPATASKAVGVGAATNPQKIPYIYEPLNEKTIQISPVDGSVPWNLSKDYPIVRLAEQGDINGKIAVITRSETPFYELIQTAEQKGAVAAIIYNNDEAFQGAITNEEDPITIPAAAIAGNDGKWLLNKMKTKTLYMDTRYEEMETTTATFSSRGPVTVNWRIKPDILAPGTNILSTVPGGYDAFNGTSMAAPHVTGAIAVIKEAKPNWTNKQIIGALKTTAQPIKVDGELLEPNVQGMGNISISQALHTKTIITEPLLTFGKMEDYKVINERNITIENMSDAPQTFHFNIPKQRKGLTFKLPQSFTVKKGEKKQLPIELTTIPSLINEGIYQDWIVLESKDTEKTIHLPYLFVNQTADYEKATGFQFSLNPFSDNHTYTYQLYMTERANKVDVHLYDAESLLYKQKLLTLKDVDIGMNKGEIENVKINPGYYKAVITVELESGAYESHETELMIDGAQPNK
ncbi:S8 family serine peptidase [Virgibacillus sp. W0181]|uniref:S8 family serine peptidase n=1 Tax=Virgibacillus sp. W0181 TaxID=3391581 RepID=UPI003F4778FB